MVGLYLLSWNRSDTVVKYKEWGAIQMEIYRYEQKKGRNVKKAAAWWLVLARWHSNSI